MLIKPIVMLVHWVVSAIAILITAFVVPGFKVRGFKGAMITAIFIGLGNIVIYPLLYFLTWPINVVTLGLFTFVLSAIILRLCAAVLKDFEITSWTSALIGAVLLSFVSSGLHFFIG